ncbi:MAG TPA: hypothetical protein PLE33_02050, partial [Candidatus Cloacimonas sp.]|nr:hypothetical protein [Candidatus Cloacimonas sp.]
EGWRPRQPKKSGGLASSPTKKIRRVGVLANQKNPEGWRPRQPIKIWYGMNRIKGILGIKRAHADYADFTDKKE